MSLSTQAQLPFGRSSPTLLYALAAAAGVGLLGYSIYFDHKRRSQPDYKQKIRENRKQKQEAKRRAHPDNAEFPNLQDKEAVEAFFFEQVQKGEEMMGEDPERGAYHLANAVVSCGQGTELLQIFQQTLPPESFNMLIQAIPKAKLRLQAAMAIHLQNGAFGAPFLQPNMLPGAGGDEDGADEDGPRDGQVFVVDDELE